MTANAAYYGVAQSRKAHQRAVVHAMRDGRPICGATGRGTFVPTIKGVDCARCLTLITV